MTTNLLSGHLNWKKVGMMCYKLSKPPMIINSLSVSLQMPLVRTTAYTMYNCDPADASDHTAILIENTNLSFLIWKIRQCTAHMAH